MTDRQHGDATRTAGEGQTASPPPGIQEHATGPVSDAIPQHLSRPRGDFAPAVNYATGPAPSNGGPPLPENVQKCGDFGGASARKKGRKCGRVAGTGTDHYGVGRCYEHDEALHALTYDKAKEAFLEHYRNQQTAHGKIRSMRKAAAMAGISGETVWRLRRIDPVFDAQVAQVQQEVRLQRLHALEETAFERVLDPKVAADPLRKFLLQRLDRGTFGEGPKRVEHTGAGGGPIRSTTVHAAVLAVWQIGPFKVPFHDK